MLQFMGDPWVGKIPWRRKWQPTAVFLPEEFHGHRSLGCRLWGRTESGLHARGKGERVMVLESREGTRASRRVRANEGTRTKAQG